MRKKIVAGNWKMNLNANEAKELFSNLLDRMPECGPNQKILIFPPNIYLSEFIEQNNGNIEIGAQNLHDKNNGAFTGEVSASQLRSIGCTWVLVGHSERRILFREENEVLVSKISAALKVGLKVIYCCGESLEERKSQQHFAKIQSQIQFLGDFSAKEMESIAVAYEPIWAIGTGVTASAHQAGEMHDLIRAELTRLFGAAVSESISLLYGGSCSPKNASELFCCKNIDGGLIGGASLDAESFHSIVMAEK
jgi:triosephosphate isomerase